MNCCGFMSLSRAPVMKREIAEAKTPRTSINYEKPLIAVHENGNVLMCITGISIPIIEIRVNNIVFEMSALTPTDVTKFVMRYFDLILETYDRITITNNFGLRRVTVNLTQQSSSGDPTISLSRVGDPLTSLSEHTLQQSCSLRKVPQATASRTTLIPIMPSSSTQDRPSNEPLIIASKEKQAAARQELSMLLDNMFLIKTMRRSST